MLEIEPLPGEQGAEEPSAGPLARLRAKRQRLETQGTEEFEHPCIDGLHVLYRRLAAEESARILHGPGEQSPLQRNAQFLVTACETIVYREDGQDLLTFSGYTRELAEALAIETDPHGEMGEAQQIVLGTFGGFEQMLLTHGYAVHAWMFTVRKTDDEALSGESTGTQASR